MRLDERLLALAARLGMPRRRALAALRGWRRIGRAAAIRERREAAERYLRQVPPAIRIPRDAGHAAMPGGNDPAMAALLDAARRLFAARRDTAAGSQKRFFYDLLGPADLDAEPALIDFAVRDEILAPVVDYLGAVPRLRHVGLHLSPPGEGTRSSQLFHRDGADLMQVKGFINVDAVGTDDGPFTLVPAARSEQVAAELGWNGWGRLADDEVLPQVPAGELVELTGPPGTGVLADTSRCLHFGSRARTGHRLVVMFQFTNEPDSMVAAEDEGGALGEAAAARYAADPVRALLFRKA